ncbi:MAG TPA: hypothetical protein VK506_12415, partial [Conexibacter sp.]|nr:hypothetical protein [Conexibacter sp.]
MPALDVAEAANCALLLTGGFGLAPTLLLGLRHMAPRCAGARRAVGVLFRPAPVDPRDFAMRCPSCGEWVGPARALSEPTLRNMSLPAAIGLGAVLGLALGVVVSLTTDVP